jgi:hypothetical protein
VLAVLPISGNEIHTISFYINAESKKFVMIPHLTPSHAYLLTPMLSNGAAPSGAGAATTGFHWLIVKCSSKALTCIIPYRNTTALISLSSRLKKRGPILEWCVQRDGARTLIPKLQYPLFTAHDKLMLFWVDRCILYLGRPKPPILPRNSKCRKRLPAERLLSLLPLTLIQISGPKLCCACPPLDALQYIKLVLCLLTAVCHILCCFSKYHNTIYWPKVLLSKKYCIVLLHSDPLHTIPPPESTILDCTIIQYVVVQER